MWTWVNSLLRPNQRASAGRTVREVEAADLQQHQSRHGQAAKIQCALASNSWGEGLACVAGAGARGGDDFRRLRDRLARLPSAGHVVSRSAFDQGAGSGLIRR